MPPVSAYRSAGPREAEARQRARAPRSCVPWLLVLVCSPQAIYACTAEKALGIPDTIAIVIAVAGVIAAIFPDR